jgi:hypothetical protein
MPIIAGSSTLRFSGWATDQLFGEGAARTAGSLWVEELEASPNHFRGRRFALMDCDDIRRKPTCRSDVQPVRRQPIAPASVMQVGGSPGAVKNAIVLWKSA